MTSSKAMVFAGQPCYDVETRYLVRSSYSADTLAAAHTSEDCYPTIVTLHELHVGPLTPAQLKYILELGGLSIK
eukprot:2061156-Pyramimonas_sp.AAC.1